MAFTKLLLNMRERFLRFPEKTRWFQPVAGGLMVGLFGWFVPQVLGVGYSYVGDALNGKMALNLMLLLIVLKLLTVTTSYASGNAGGIFGPALFIGAMLGGSLGTLAHRFFPGYTATPGAYALVGMGAAFAGIVRAPMTSVLMIFEMTQDYAVIVPLIPRQSVHFFTTSAHTDLRSAGNTGRNTLPSGESHRNSQRQVIRIMRKPAESLPSDLTVRQASERIESSGWQSWLVTEGTRVIGVINLATLEGELEENPDKKIGQLVNAINFPHVHSDQSLDLALERMGANRIQLLPVVSRADVHQLLGIVTIRHRNAW